MIFVKSIFLLLTTGFLLTAGSFNWTAPPPAWSPTGANDIRTVKHQVSNGSTNVALRWNYTLGTGEFLSSTAWQLDGTQIVFVSVTGATRIKDDRFDVSKSEVATLIIKNVSELEDATIQCVVQTDVGNWKYDIRLEITVPTRMTSYSDNQTVTEGSNLSLFCNATGKPTPIITWTRVSEDEVLFVGNPWNISNINRTYRGTYRCVADNRVSSPVNSTISINVLFKPDVTLKRNTTENIGCTDMWVNFTCKSSEANPPVYNYVLFKNEKDVLSEKGTWIEKISRGETFVYKCQAYQQVDNVTSTNNISLSVKVPVSVEQIQNITVEEGRNVAEECNVSAGTLPRNFFWKNMKTGQVTTGKLLNISNIRRNESGEYRCTANNTCGNESTGMFIDVHFKPDNVTLERNTTENNGCTDMWVNFTCKSSEANPPVYNYVLLRNEIGVRLSEKGTWTEKISRGETFVFKCQAYQQVDNVTSTNNISLSVKVPVAVEQIQNVTVEEGRNVTKECNVTAGTHPLNVSWENVKTGQVTKGKLLTIINIRRNQRGEYRCTANNTCGNESTGMFIDVHYGPDQVNLDIAPSGTGCRGSTFQFTCTADANPPVHTYVLFQNGTRDSTNKSGTWTKTMNSIGKFVFKCEAYSSKGNSTSRDTLLNVDDPPAVKLTSKVTVKEGENVTGECNLTAGTPPPYQFWQNVKTGQFVKTGKLLTITNITRHQTEYKCVANNTCGRASATMFIDVKYGPSANPLKIKPVTEGEHVAIPCLEDSGNPPAVVTWYKGNDTSGNETTNSSTLEVQNAAPSDEGWYTCFAKNDVGNASATFFLRVAPKTSSAPITEPSTVSILCSKALSENELRVSVTVEADCKNGSQVADKLVDKIVELLKNESCELGVSCVIKCGSVVVDSVLKFSKAIDGARVVSILKEAAEQGRFNGLKVVSDSITQIPDTTTSLASTESPSPTEPVCRKSFFEKENCEKNWLIIGILIGSMVLLCVIICCLITRWVLKQRKCKKDTRVANSAVDVQPLSSNHSTLSGDKPCDYAMSGPQPPVEVEVAVCEEIPTYAVVDKAKKKDKKKNKKAAEQKAIDDQYAAVDKSKKNKKNEPDNTYAEVDMSNKSKKKPKLGEVLYADLGEFHQMQKLPEVSTSPKTLPPIKRPEAYAETQYADITQFLKGNPEATGADHPKDGAASSASSNGQGSATGRKEESSAGNTGDSAGATNDTGF